MVVINDNWATVGSSNINPFSLLLAHDPNTVAQESICNTTKTRDYAVDSR